MSLYEHVFIARQDLSIPQAEGLVDHFTKFLTPISKDVEGLKPVHDLSLSLFAEVLLTSPGCMGINSFIDSIPNSFSNKFTQYWIRNIWNIFFKPIIDSFLVEIIFDYPLVFIFFDTH